MASLKRIDIKTLGLWNPRIFNPVWLKTVLTPIIPDFKDEDILGNLNVTELTVSYKIRSFELKPTYESFIFEIHQFGSEQLAMAFAAFSAMISRLNQTPIKASGINFVFDIPSEENSLIMSLFTSIESSANNKIGYIPTQLVKPNSGNGYSTNIVREIVNGNNIFIINFHYEPQIFTKVLGEKGANLILEHLIEAKGIVDET